MPKTLGPKERPGKKVTFSDAHGAGIALRTAKRPTSARRRKIARPRRPSRIAWPPVPWRNTIGGGHSHIARRMPGRL